MPVYRYKCLDCGTDFEKNLRMQDSDRTIECPSGHKNVRRVFIAPSIVFKGSGFYVNDHPRQAAPKDS
jgi:putative FmdB family regulatory protein